ncbi:MAG: hypothetical protein MJ202_04255 [Lentisphaeria bacterium]|nr:hypothetical protein [Lentisphaeria bacterium]
MLIDIYDLFGAQTWYRFTETSSSQVRLLQEQQFPDLLIYPRRLQNKCAYLQDCLNPILEDFIDGNGRLDYGNSFFLADILQAIEEHQATFSSGHQTPIQALSDFFAQVQGQVLHQQSEADWNIIVVPDHYDAEAQEILLQQCHLSRVKTLLLWRSVAACIGQENQLVLQGATEDMTIVIVDYRNTGTNISRLRLKNDRGRLVPQRRSYSMHRKEDFTEANSQKRRKPRFDVLDAEEEKFARHLYGLRQECLPIFSSGKWQMKKTQFTFPTFDLSENFLPQNDFVTVADSCPITQSGWKKHRILQNFSDECDYIALGAARFAIRNANGLPTYFDGREALWIIVQDQFKETIGREKLIEENEFCRGGEKYVGSPIVDKFYVEGGSNIEFLLQSGNAYTNPLKKLIQTFEFSIGQRQNLTLYPSMTVGQGMAQVRVTGEPLLKEEVKLDFLKMAPTSETLVSLNQRLKRSFPADIPQVCANDRLWSKIVDKVNSYLENYILPSGGWFAQTEFPFRKDSDLIKRMQRENVFGTDPLCRVPASLSPRAQYKLYAKLAKDYNYYKYVCQTPDDAFHNDRQAKRLLNQIIRLIAWTYQSDNPLFNNIKDEIFAHLYEASENSKFSLLPQEYTFCAHFSNASHDFQLYTQAIINLQESRGTDRINNWLRGYYALLSLNNNALENISTEQCLEISEYLYEIVIKNITPVCHSTVITNALRVMLFLLRRRRYDRTFLAKGSERCQAWLNCLNAITLPPENMDILSFAHHPCLPQSLLDCCKSLKDFLNNEGTLEGIPKILEDADTDNDSERE